MKIYISGPMTGIPNFNSTAFNSAEKKLRDAGWLPVNPIALDAAKGDTYHDEKATGVWESKHRTDYLRRDIALLASGEIGAIYMLQGYEKSKGALLELEVAKGLGLSIHYEAKGGKLPSSLWPVNVPIQDEDEERMSKLMAAPLAQSIDAWFGHAKRPGRKDDADKIPHHLLPFDALQEVSKVLQAGAKKYEPRNWEKGMAWHRPFRAANGHLWDWWLGKKQDEETKLSPLAHAACEVLFLLAYELRNIGEDDRP